MLLRIASLFIRISPERIGYAITKKLAARTQRLPISKVESRALGDAKRIHYGKDGRNVAWSWGEGPIVILVHGWGGQAAQMAPLASHLANLGFHAVAIDITGHGHSPGSSIRWQYFLDDVAELSSRFDGAIHAYVAHSAGALSTMAARKLKRIHASRYICICAPSHPYPPIEVIRKKLRPPENIVARYKTHIARQFESSWDALEPGASYVDTGSNLLLFYDETDRFVSHSEGDKIRAINQDALLVKTNGYSHAKILQSPELLDAAGRFLKL
jgi:hypothetical protein